ncbi:MAG: RidA family protein [Chloroflexota bacterium]
MSKQVIHTEHAPAAVGPYSQAIVANGFVYTAGQIAIVPAEGKMLDGDVQAQTRLALQNLQAVLEAAGSDLTQVVKTTVFLDSMDDFAKMNEIYAEFFGENPPARSAVEAARLPLGALVEIEAVALVIS